VIWNVNAALAAVAAIAAVVAPVALGPGVAEADPAQVLVVGDSLAVGIRPFLREMIANREVTFDAKAGRTTPQGMEALRLELAQYAPQTVVISLGTNDGSDPDVFADRVHRTLREVPPGACVVWPAIVRPPRKGEYAALNRVLRAIARQDPRLTVVPWDRMVHKGTVRLRDGIHPTVAGYRFRAYVIAAAVQRGCG
jgi:lysophospholipase L1-like esterase